MKKKYMVIILSLTSTAVVLLAAAVILILNTPQAPLTAASETSVLSETAAVITEARADTQAPVTEAPTEAPTEPPTEAPPAAPGDMTDILAQNGNSLDDLSSLGCSQLVTVSSYGSSAAIRYYELEDNNTWTEDESLRCSGYVGRNGVTADMHEGGYASPMGLYHIGDAFYIYSQPDTGLSSFQVTADTYWVDDPDSAYYNQRVEGTANKDWSSAEHMIDIPQYEYGFVIDYNTEAVYNAGSAIFFHISYGGTAGCVGTDRDHVLSYLSKLDASRNPYIIIV
ncbi:MAG: hypothetical protein IJH07_06200 [Ruminococcus sp.]|nr:hypothetical protein [Ruminococcus sp.]